MTQLEREKTATARKRDVICGAQGGREGGKEGAEVLVQSLLTISGGSSRAWSQAWAFEGRSQATAQTWCPGSPTGLQKHVLVSKMKMQRGHHMKSGAGLGIFKGKERE